MAVLRTNETTHKRLKELAETTDLPIQTVLDHAVETYRRTVFLEQLNRDFAALRADPQVWQEEQEERTLWEQALADGLMNAT